MPESNIILIDIQKGTDVVELYTFISVCRKQNILWLLFTKEELVIVTKEFPW